ncbi:glycosyltransferase family 4 protein [Limnohabitans sp. Jir72]|uniref:glycosyltransferase family 4 protein n=1 Tax=Limnohabitans sp. Jir72 TaxID=1977909 RepID=UPI000D3401C7|nr:glycosyltransferase family 4 protein [Limnohabitans sp. Jir72]PUE28097.1 hypothetical protein B9Z52_14575 [Limnohabitans sp. Jir72]
MDSHICFVGPLPPPVHGYSEINKRMLGVLSSQHKIHIFDMSPRDKTFGFLLLWWRFSKLIFGNKPNALYLAFSGGLRQWIDLVFILIAGWRGVPIYIHHHSFAYLSQKNRSVIMSLGVVRNSFHIVLCNKMGEKINQLYGIEHKNIRSISNAAFLEEISVSDHARNVSTSLRLGFLSNITAEKGIFEFFSVLSQAVSHGVSLQGLIAGPVDESVRDNFHKSLASHPNAIYLGPVYGADKIAFFASIDVLFFPTRYPNEAQPVTILEALAHCVPVIAFARGCIASMVPDGAGVVFPYSEGFVTQTITALRPLAESSVALEKARQAARLAFESQRDINRIVLENLVVEIGSSSEKKQVKT